MTDYPELYKRLAQAILKHEGQIGTDAAAFVADLVKSLRHSGLLITPDIEQQLTDYLTAMQSAIKVGITSAVGLAVANLPAIAQSATVAKLVSEAYTQRWPDGLTLSKRLWRWDESVRTGLSDTLKAGIEHGKAVNTIVYDMQRTIEKAHSGQVFKIVQSHQDDWVKELHESAVGMINDPTAHQLWNDTVAEVEERIASLATNGTKHAAERVLSQIQAAVAKGSEKLADQAAKWWMYDKQLYHLKRIVRTEMATSMHQAVIASTIDDETIIGYQWRLSSSHPRPDICDYYADIDMGLGRGVFDKDSVPPNKAHPHCMCLLVPRVTPIARKGKKNYAEFIDKLPEAQRNNLLPKWAVEAVSQGTPINQLIAANGLGIISKKQALANGVISATNHAYEAAKAGGKHAGLLKNYRALPVPMIERAIGSMEKTIALHESWIKNPDLKLKPDEDPRRVTALVEQKWPSDIQRITTEANVLRGLLKEKKR